MNHEVVQTFVRLFRGRGDARGRWSGSAIRERVTVDHFAAHLTSPLESDWFGVYNVLGERCSWGCVDIDSKDLPLASNVSLALWRQRIPAWVEATDRGFHVWVFPDPPLVSALAMRQALTAACYAVSYVPREVFPKQVRTSGTGLGNFVRLPLNGAYSGAHIAATRRFLGGPPLSELDRHRAPSDHLERVAAMLPRPQSVDISVDLESGLEYRDVARRIGGLVWRIWSYGPGKGHDRSTTLTELAHLCHEQDVDATTAFNLCASADNRWGKGFLERGEPGVECLRRIIVNAYGTVAV